MSQTLIVHVIRSRGLPLVQSRSSRTLGLATVVVMALACALPYFPDQQHIVGLLPLPPLYFAFLAAMMVTYIAFTQIAKTFFYTCLSSTRHTYKANTADKTTLNNNNTQAQAGEAAAPVILDIAAASSLRQAGVELASPAASSARPVDPAA